MVENLRKSLDKKSKLIHRHFIMSPSVIDVSRKEGLLDDADVRALADLEDNQMRINLMMEMIRSRGFEFYRKFLIVLRKTGHTSLADKLEPVVTEKQVTFNPIPPVKEVTKTPTSESGSESSSSSSSSSSDSDSSDDSRKRRKKKKGDKDGEFGNVPDLRFPKPILGNSPREGPPHAEASAAIDGLYMHYDQAKVLYRRQLDQLRHEEQKLRSSLIVNQHEQRTLRRNLGLVTTVKRQIAFVNDKQTMMMSGDIDSEEKINDLAKARDGNDSLNLSNLKGKHSSLRKSWKY